MTGTDPEPAAPGAPVAAAADARVATVLVVSKTHLDVGFTGTAAQVRARYLDEYFPRAMSVADRLRDRGGPERFRWTTGSWILTEALDAADRTRRADLEQAIEHGDLCWHALPFTLHTEYCDRSLLEHGLSLSAELDRRFGRHTRAAKVTDVPGHTRGLVSALADAGVDFLHVGVNPASACPEVPHRFRWVDPAAGADGDRPSIQVMYQPGGYGDVQIVDGPGVDGPGPSGPVAVVVDLTGDNLGPRRADEVIAQWAALSRRFPSAQIAAATLDDVAAVMAATAETLPVLDAEIGDTWIQGVGSDPAKTAGFRELCRLRRRWIDSGLVTVDDPSLRAASTSLLCVAEHTWGLDQKTHWPDTTHWSADALASLLAGSADPRNSGELEPGAAPAFAESWAEQRSYLDGFVDRLAEGGRHDLADEARRVLDATRTVGQRVGVVDAAAADASAGATARSTPGGVAEPSRDESVPVTARLGGLALTFDTDGALIGLRSIDGHSGDRHDGDGYDADGRELASPDAPLARLAFQTFDAADFERWYSTYNAGTTDEDQWWARWDNTKPGLDGSGALSCWWTPRLTDVVEQGDRVVAELSFDAPADAPVSLPARAELAVRRVDDDDADDAAVEFELQWFDRPAARWPGAVWWTFAPPVEQPEHWRMSKLDEWVSPFDVVRGGGVHLHCADRVRHAVAGVELELVDTSLVAPGRTRLLEWPPVPVDLSDGWHVCLHDNVWGTNFPMWDDGSSRFRVHLRWARAGAWRTS